MKISKTEFKAIIKESLKELINEGALNGVLGQLIAEASMIGGVPVQQQHQQENHRARIAAMAVGGRDSGLRNVLEEVFTDTLQNTIPERHNQELKASTGVELADLQKYGVSFPTVNEAQVQQPAFNPSFVAPQQQYMQAPVPQRNPLPPRDPNYQGQQAGMLNESNGGGGWVSNWQRLALGTPQSNRPSAESAALFGGGEASRGFLPGVKPKR